MATVMILPPHSAIPACRVGDRRSGLWRTFLEKLRQPPGVKERLVFNRCDLLFGRWTLTQLPSSPAQRAAYLQQQVEQDSLTAFSTASRVSPVRF
jgi:hypothetical protein